MVLVFYIDLATALSLDKVVSLPRTDMVRLRAGENGAKLREMRMRLKSSAGFLFVAVRRLFRTS